MGHLDDLVDLAQCKQLQTAAAKSTTVLNDTKAGVHKQITHDLFENDAAAVVPFVNGRCHF